MRAAKDRLHAAIDAYRAKEGDGLDQHAKDVLNRLAADGRAADAFVAVLPNGDHWDVLISDCITASERARTHAERICALRKRLQKAPGAIKAVETIADFFDGIQSEPFDPVKEALGYLCVQIDDWRRFTEESLGALSRKKDASAARAESLRLAACERLGRVEAAESFTRRRARRDSAGNERHRSE